MSARVLGILIALCTPLLANAAEIDIPSQSLSASLRDLARQADVQIVAFSRVVEGRNAPRLKGDYTPEAALAALLAGSDLAYLPLNGRAFEITARPADPTRAAGNPPLASELDEVEITARREKLSQMRAQIQKLEDQFFARYNELNTNPAYDIACREEARTGTHVVKRICLPQFAVDPRRFKDGRLSYFNVDLPVKVPMEQTPDYQKQMVELVKQHPDLLKLLQERDSLARRYEATRQRKLKGKIYVWD